MTARDTKVIGYFAYMSTAEVICTDDACVISGSSDEMERYVEELHPGRANKATVKKTRFGEIRLGIEMGAAYAFDEASYERFYPLAREAGILVERADFEEARKRNMRFFTVRPNERAVQQRLAPDRARRSGLRFSSGASR